MWAINSYCMVLYQSLMYNICITFSLVCHCCPVSSVSSEIMSYSLFMFNCHGSRFFIEWTETRRNYDVKTLWPVTNMAWIYSIETDAIESLGREKRTGSLLVAHHDVDMGLAHDLCSVYGMSMRIWKQCCIHVTISFQMLSPIQNFPLKFLYFDIIKNPKEDFFFLVGFVSWSSSDPICEEGVVHMLNTGCRYWTESGEGSVGKGAA